MLARFRIWLLLCCLACVLALPALAPAQAQAQAVPVAGVLRLETVTNGVNLRLALSGPLPETPRVLALDNPMRWAVDLGGASSLRRDIPGAGAAKGARVSQFDPRTVRIVLDLARPLQLVSAVQDRDNVLELRFRTVTQAEFTARTKSGRVPFTRFMQENLIAVPPGPKPAPDLARESERRLDRVEAALATAERQVAGVEPTETPETDAAPAPPPPRPARPARRPLIVIDAGHGGKDPGAPSVNGGHEKTVTLAIARATKREIERRGGMDVRLTREDDRFLTLGERVRLARQWGADLFISVHADSAPNKDARGASVYTLSDVASDREAARVAAKENRADLIAGVDLSQENREVTSLLLDLAQRASMNASSEFAETLQQAMTPRGVLFRSQFHRFAGFQVLRNFGVPAVLLETGYLSNSEDSRYLFSSKGQQAIAAGIADAAATYLKGRK